jgi:hypothetical protein
MSAYQLFMLEWLLSSYKENVELILVASIKESVNWVWALLLIFVCTPSKKVQQSLMVIQVLVLHAGCQYLIVYRNSCGSIKDFDQLELKKGPRADQHFILLTHFGGHADLTVLHQLGIFTELDDSVGTYWTPDDINYTEAVTRHKYRCYAGSNNSSHYLRFLRWWSTFLHAK